MTMYNYRHSNHHHYRIPGSRNIFPPRLFLQWLSFDEENACLDLATTVLEDMVGLEKDGLDPK